MSIVTRRGGETQVIFKPGGLGPLSLDIIVEGKDRDALVVKVGKEEWGQSPWSLAVMNMLDDQKTVSEFCLFIGLKVSGPGVRFWAFFINIGVVFL